MTRAVWFESPGVATLRDEPTPQPGAGEVLVETRASGVSAGTERVVLRGEVPRASRASMKLPSTRGDFDFPISYGYACVGEIVSTGARVFALHPHHDVFVASAAELRPLPAGVSPARCTLAANVETAINVIWDAEIALGDRVVVAGLGVVGWLVAWLAARSGASSVVAIDAHAGRRAIAPASVAAVEAIEDAALARADVVIEASGSPELLAAIVGGAGFEARVVVVSWYGDRALALPLGASFHSNRVTIRSSQVGAIPPSHRARWDFDRRWSLVTDLLAADALDVLIARPVPLADAPRLYAELARGAIACPPHLVFDHRAR